MAIPEEEVVATLVEEEEVATLAEEAEAATPEEGDLLLRHLQQQGQPMAA